MHTLIEMFGFPFMQRAFFAAVLIALACASSGVFVVQRGLAFLGDGLAHATFGGLGLGVLLGFAPEAALWVALPFTLVVAWGVGWVSRREGFRPDVSLAVFFPITLALGVLFIALRGSGAPPVNLEAVLFGGILGVSAGDIYFIALAAFLSLTILVIYGGRLAYAGFDADLAKLSLIRIEILEMMFLSLTAVITVIGVKTVGVALISSLLVIPAVCAQMVRKTIFGQIIWANVFAGLSAVAGLTLSYVLNVPSGATIVLALGSVFSAIFLWRKILVL